MIHVTEHERTDINWFHADGERGQEDKDRVIRAIFT
jgi:hypothetical protein